MISGNTAPILVRYFVFSKNGVVTVIGKYQALRIAERLESIRGWAMHGSTIAEIAKMLGVAESTIYKWKTEHEEFAEAIKKGATEADGEILNAAFRQAVGYVTHVIEPMKVKKQRWDERAMRVLTDEEVVMTEYDKTIPPDANMTRFMLTNRLPGHYKVKPTEEDDGGSITLIHQVERGKMDNGKDS